jgi:hypothetical protein
MVDESEKRVSKHSRDMGQLIPEVNRFCLVGSIVNPVVNGATIHAKNDNHSENRSDVLEGLGVLNVAKTKEDRKETEHAQACVVHPRVFF